MKDYLDQPLEPDPVIEVYKRDVDVTLLIEQLRRTPLQRLEVLEAMAQFLEIARRSNVHRETRSVEGSPAP